MKSDKTIIAMYYIFDKVYFTTDTNDFINKLQFLKMIVGMWAFKTLILVSRGKHLFIFLILYF